MEAVEGWRGALLEQAFDLACRDADGSAQSMDAIAKWAGNVNKTALTSKWDADYKLLFRDALQFGHGEELSEILRRTNRPDVWANYLEALSVKLGHKQLVSVTPAVQLIVKSLESL